MKKYFKKRKSTLKNSISRRKFIEYLGILIFSSFVASMFLSLFKKCRGEIVEKERIKATTVDRIKRKGYEKVVVDGNPILFIYRENEVSALSLICPHRGCVVSLSSIEKGFIECPCHGSKFTIEGRRISGPSPQDLRKIEIEIENKDVYVLV